MTCAIQNSSPNYTTLQNIAGENQLISELSITESSENHSHFTRDLTRLPWTRRRSYQIDLAIDLADRMAELARVGGLT